MFRLTQFMEEVRNPTPIRGRRNPPGPVVIWNLIRRCNLTCKHCYSLSADTDFPGELRTSEAFAVLDDLQGFGVPMLILSGGEPLLRPDIFEISRRAKTLGLAVGLSTNGTLIDDETADRIAAVGYDYIGISLDGIGAVHDSFRRQPGAYAAALAGLRLCRDRGLKVGVRFTLTLDNAAELPLLLRLVEDEGIDRFYLSHLNYAGRGDRNRAADAAHETTRRAMDLLFETCWTGLEQGRRKEIVTGNNDADGIYFLLWASRRFPERAAHLRAKLAEWGGNASGVNIGNIDNLGNVHPDTFWWQYSLGNVRERPFSAIWLDTSDPIMARLKRRPRQLKGRCGHCPFIDICGGNTRMRALRLTGDPWEEDPACYLTAGELGLPDQPRRVRLTPYRAREPRSGHGLPDS